MSKYYKDYTFEQLAGTKEDPLILNTFKNPSKFKLGLTTSGNLIIESKLLSRWINRQRTYLVGQYLECIKYVDAVKQYRDDKIRRSRKYLMREIFTNEYENKNELVPGTAVTIGAFLFGRIISNEKNWNLNNRLLHRKPTLMSGLLTSYPSKLTLPLIFSSIAFSQYVPIAWSNIVKSFENDVLPDELVVSYHQFMTRFYYNGILQKFNDFEDYLQNDLVDNIKNAREVIIRQLY